MIMCTQLRTLRTGSYAPTVVLAFGKVYRDTIYNWYMCEKDTDQTISSKAYTSTRFSGQDTDIRALGYSILVYIDVRLQVACMSVVPTD